MEKFDKHDLESWREIQSRVIKMVCDELKGRMLKKTASATAEHLAMVDDFGLGSAMIHSLVRFLVLSSETQEELQHLLKTPLWISADETLPDIVSFSPSPGSNPLCFVPARIELKSPDLEF